jgi:hypothetical protein
MYPHLLSFSRGYLLDLEEVIICIHLWLVAALGDNAPCFYIYRMLIVLVKFKPY